jgi:hypothetical protein
MLIKRILMNAADQGGGAAAPPAGGNAPPAAPAPAPAPASVQPQANGAIVSLDPASIAAIVTTVKNSVFAEARRAGMLPGEKPKATATEGGAPAATPGPDLSKLRSLDRVLGRTGLATSISEMQYARLERDYIAETPDNVEDWVKAYFPGSSGSPATPQAPASPAAQPAASPAAQSQPQPQNAQPVSDRGSPPVPRAPLEEQSLLTMSPSDRDAVRRLKGDGWFSDTLHRQLRDGNVRFRLK